MRSKRSDDLDPGKTGLRNHRVNHKMWDLPTRNPEDRAFISRFACSSLRSCSGAWPGSAFGRSARDGNVNGRSLTSGTVVVLDNWRHELIADPGRRAGGG